VAELRVTGIIALFCEPVPSVMLTELEILITGVTDSFFLQEVVAIASKMSKEKKIVRFFIDISDFIF